MRKEPDGPWWRVERLVPPGPGRSRHGTGHTRDATLLSTTQAAIASRSREALHSSNRVSPPGSADLGLARATRETRLYFRQRKRRSLHARASPARLEPPFSAWPGRSRPGTGHTRDATLLSTTQAAHRFACARGPAQLEPPPSAWSGRSRPGTGHTRDATLLSTTQAAIASRAREHQQRLCVPENLLPRFRKFCDLQQCRSRRGVAHRRAGAWS